MAYTATQLFDMTCQADDTDESQLSQSSSEGSLKDFVIPDNDTEPSSPWQHRQPDFGEIPHDTIIPETPLNSTTPPSHQIEDDTSSEPDIDFEDPLDNIGNFRLAAKSVFITYPKCNLDPKEFDDKLQKIAKFDSYYAVQEQHKDGTPHFHVLGEWKKKKNIRNPRAFDIAGYHPNIGRTKNRLAAWRYINKTKGRSVHIGGDMSEPRSLQQTGKGTWWEDAIKIDDRTNFFAKFAQESPRDLILHFNNIMAYANDKYRPPIPEYHTPDLQGSWKLPPAITEWKHANIDKKQPRPKSLCLYGDTRLFKTIWARSIGPHCYMSGCWNASLLDGDKQYAVIDDIPLSDKDMLKHYKQILGCQSNFSVTDKYLKKVHFPKWGLPCIYLSNEDPRYYTGVDMKWLEGNCTFVHVTEPLFEERPSSVNESELLALAEEDSFNE